jgi:secreted trypsin-like serine protease
MEWVMKKLLVTNISVLIAVFSLGALTACGNPKSSSSQNLMAKNILGGTNSDLTFQKNNGVVLVLILKELPAATPGGGVRQQISNCTGTLISETVVLTAAHCLLGKNIVSVGVGFDTSLDGTSEENFILVSDAIVNGDFNPQIKNGTTFIPGESANDIALLKLSKPAPADFKPATLPKETQPAMTSKSKVLLAGYGSNVAILNVVKKNAETGVEELFRVPGNNGSGLLRQVDNVSVKTVTEDNKEFEVNQEDGKKGACHGDSGGPAFLKLSNGTSVLVGVTSRGTNLLGNCDKTAVYTSVAGYLDWINNNMP